MPRFEKPLPPGLRRYWPVWLLVLAGAVGLASLADASLSHGLQAWPEPVRSVFSVITDIGLGQWYLVPSLTLTLGFAVAAVLARPPLWKLAAVEMMRVSGFVFVAVGLAGLAGNLLKRIVGRARPVFLDTLGPFDFHSLAFDWRYESFPSGHSATIFAVAMVVGFLLPRAFWYAVALALLVALSRIVVGAHFLTDVLGGAVCGTAVVWLVRAFFAGRGWVFRRHDDGSIVQRGFPATGALLRGRRRGQRPAR